jgi:hypothetical protein
MKTGLPSGFDRLKEPSPKGADMNNLKRVVVSLSLIFVITATALAGETQAPPCAPGETQAPPCSSAQLTTEDSTAGVQTDSSTEPTTLDLTSLATDVVSALLVLF